MRRVLIVSPRFPPTVAPDYHRIRMLLPALEKQGWHSTVLCVDSRFVDGAREPQLLLTIPSGVEVVRVGALPLRIGRLFGFGALSLRAGFQLRSAGDALLAREKFDLVFFSTTEFPVLTLGPRWVRRFNVPYVVDFQDPWITSYYEDSGVRPPGGRFRHGAHQFFARSREREVVEGASHVVSVSSAYVREFEDRYPLANRTRFSVIPFAGSRSDFSLAASTPATTALLPFDASVKNWVYAGAISQGMERAIEAFFLALVKALELELVARDRLHIHFIGTDYATGSRAAARVMPIAERYGLADCVREHPARIGYLDTLRCLLASDALLMFGSDDPAYNASKLFPYILAARPLLSIFRKESAVADVMQRSRAGVSVERRADESIAGLADVLFDRWFATRAFDLTPDTRWAEVEPMTDTGLSRRLIDILESAAGDSAHTDSA